MAGDRILAFDNAGRLSAIRASDRRRPCGTTTDPVSGSYFDLLVVGTSVFVRDSGQGRQGVSPPSTASALWGGAATAVGRLPVRAEQRRHVDLRRRRTASSTRSRCPTDSTQWHQPISTHQRRTAASRTTTRRTLRSWSPERCMASEPSEAR